MKKIILTFLIFTINFALIGQQLHTPAEILKIMVDSEISYMLDVNEGFTKYLPDRSELLNTNEYYRVYEGDNIITRQYKINEKAEEYHSKAENYFMQNKYTAARDMYLKALEADPEYYKVMVYIGQTYSIEGDLDKAIEWYEKAISNNYIDYMAHWFLSGVYRKKGEMKKALDEVTIAMILNRNNPRIKKLFDDIYKLNKLSTADWTFNPEYELEQEDNGDIRLKSNLVWMSYGIVKALWKYEPGYKESMGVNENQFSTLEEKECIVSLITAIDKKKLKKHPELKALQKALDTGMVDEFIFYEIYLLDHPSIAYQLPEEVINNIKNYVIQVRGKIK